MEEMFEVIVALIVIIGSLVKTAGKSRKIKENAPGKAAAPARPAVAEAPVQRPQPERSARPVPAQPTVQPMVHPTEKPADIPDFWQQMSRAFGQTAETEAADAGHEAVGKMAEGDSRECEHGSVGGSMAYEGHQEGREKRESKPQPAAATAASAYRPAMTAQEMRRAVVMAEILKRPQERMAEQARRWSAR